MLYTISSDDLASIITLLPTCPATLAFDSRTTSIRELMRQVQTPRYQKANPRLKINVNIHSTYSAPLAQFNFIDNTEVR